MLSSCRPARRAGATCFVLLDDDLDVDVFVARVDTCGVRLRVAVLARALLARRTCCVWCSGAPRGCIVVVSPSPVVVEIGEGPLQANDRPRAARAEEVRGEGGWLVHVSVFRTVMTHILCPASLFS